MRIIDVYFEVTTDKIRARVKEDFYNKEHSLLFKFSFGKSRDTNKDIINNLTRKFQDRNLKWFEFKEKTLFANLDLIKKITGLEDVEWLTGFLKVEPEIDRSENKVELNIQIFKKDVEFMNEPRKIFLSHKSSNKELVREYNKTLSLLGYEPWLDEEDMPAGTVPHRGILNGFQNSCAVVFFITSEFKDERYLANEINYAITEKTEKGDDFVIITLVMSKDVIIPDLLKTYIWKSPKNDLEALRDIINALPYQSK